MIVNESAIIINHAPPPKHSNLHALRNSEKFHAAQARRDRGGSAVVGSRSAILSRPRGDNNRAARRTYTRRSMPTLIPDQISRRLSHARRHTDTAHTRFAAGIPLTIHTGRPSSRSSQRSSGGTIGCMVARKPSNSGNSSGGEGGAGGARGPLVPQSRAGAARAAAILLISCHRQAAAAGSSGGGGPNGAGGVVVVGKHRRALSDVAEGSSDGLGRTY